VRVRVRLGGGLSRLSSAPLLSVDLADGATVEDLLGRLRETEPDLAPALRAALPGRRGRARAARPPAGRPPGSRPPAARLRRL